MGFYSAIAEYYDQIFPFEKTIGDFLLKYTDRKKPSGISVLDIACGTGTYTAYLAQNGVEATGLDVDPGMIRKAASKYNEPGLKFIEKDMLAIRDVPWETVFGIIYCIGNSAVHLKNMDEIKLFIMQCREIIKKDGKLLIQIINFDRILSKSITSLPSLINDDIVFERKYRLLDTGSISFDTKLHVKKTGESYSNSISLIPLKKDRLAEILVSCGFKVTGVFGSFSREEWSTESFLTITEASAV